MKVKSGVHGLTLSIPVVVLLICRSFGLLHSCLEVFCRWLVHGEVLLVSDYIQNTEVSL